MKYAIIRLNGQQYKVEEGKSMLIDYLGDDKLPQAEVLMVNNEGKFSIGTPVVSKAAVALKVMEVEEKGKKLDIRKFKSKSRYRKHTGFRPKYTRVMVEKIA